MDTNEQSLSLPRDLDTKVKSINDRFGKPNAWKPNAMAMTLFFPMMLVMIIRWVNNHIVNKKWNMAMQ